MEAPFLRGEHVYLRALVPEDVQGPYPGWFNDAEVCAGNGHHYFPFTAREAAAYIESVGPSPDLLAFAIVVNADDRHVGNVSLQNIDFVSRSAEFAIVIGDKTAWGKGYGTEIGRLVCDHAFFSLNLNRVACATFDTNVAMRKLAERLGMKEEGRRRQAAFKDGRWVDVIEYGLLKDEYGPPVG